MALYRVMVVAEECRALQNFNAVMTFVAALQSSPIYRLKKTWSVCIVGVCLDLELRGVLCVVRSCESQLLPSKAWDIWEALFALMDNTDNYAVYRKVMRQAEPPAIPYLGITLTDLVFLDEGNAQYVGEHKLLNMCKVLYLLTGAREDLLTHLCRSLTAPGCCTILSARRPKITSSCRCLPYRRSYGRCRASQKKSL